MRRKINKGVSMVEILISIVIFAILMTPIVSGIISSLNNTTEAKNLQYRNEFAENMVEYVKQDSLVNVMSGQYFSTLGVTDVSTNAVFYKDPNKPKYDDSLDKLAGELGGSLSVADTDVLYKDKKGTTYYPYESYSVSGKTKIGTKNETYSYKMEISNKYYADKEAADATYVNPNNLALGVVEDIDHTKVALINGTIANYDTTASDAFLTKKMEVLKTTNPDWYEIYTKQEEELVMFPGDTASRLITIKVTGEPKTGYKVTCSIKYHDNCEWSATIKNALKDYYIEYVPFEYNYFPDESGVATLPNIYLMYNVCLYNGSYSKDDYIAIDTSELDDDTKVNVFVVETAETYSKDLTTANPDKTGVDDKGNLLETLYNNNISSGSTLRTSVNIHMAATKDSKLKNVKVYHNFAIGSNKNTGRNKKNDKILYSQADAKTLFNEYFTLGTYKPLISYNEDGSAIDYDNSVANFDALDKAQEESRGLYEIRVWMQKVDDPSEIDTSKPPILTGTKGGNES